MTQFHRKQKAICLPGSGSAVQAHHAPLILKPPCTFLLQPLQVVSVTSICFSKSRALLPGARALRQTPQTGFLSFRHSCRHGVQNLEGEKERETRMRGGGRSAPGSPGPAGMQPRGEAAPQAGTLSLRALQERKPRKILNNGGF